ncbi:tetratricopeptide repeat protein [Streptomyces sp. NPDC096198]|uniref:tetratricopeptide repeat protein n=1 Tax=Streptomyces sp. NPDC096198 TaxID=3366080 RepID=UPI0037FF1BC3
MSRAADFDALRRAMADNYEQPEGPARNARAEQLLAEAERLDIPLAVIEALGHQLKVYNYSSEKDKMFVPFARLLRLWDEHPEDFDAYETHSLHWVFKWMSAGMLGQPHIPLASVEKWLGEMEHRYRLAGHSERAVRGAEFSVAAHIGDLARAERAYAAWLAADRDEMADCHACELRDQGWWQARRGEDERALELWRPVLDGTHECAHEPHAVLASSLLPLLRLGRSDEARAHHLRGFRLVRGMESMRGSYADHVEFCALTGNEARGLELLAERPQYFTDSGEPRSQLGFLAVVTLLMDRLTGLGLGDRTVPGPAGRQWTAGELAVHARGQALALAARFDARNGTPAVSERTRERMDRRPLADRLPLGVRAVRPAPVAAPAPVAPARIPEQDLPGLLAEARRLSDALHPDAVDAWAAVARAARGQELDPRDRAELVDHEAIGQGLEGADTFERAAGLHAAAGDPGEALAARARAAFVRALTGHADRSAEEVAALREEALALFTAGGTGARQTASVLVARARVLMHRLAEDERGATAAEEAVRELLAFAGPHTAEVPLASRAAEAVAMLAELAGRSGDGEEAARLLARAAEEYTAAGLPWFAVEHEARLSRLARQLGDAQGAERAARAALEHGQGQLEPVGRAQLHLGLAEALEGSERIAEAAGHALEAAHWADEGGRGRTLGAWARHRLGGLLLRQGRFAEAAEVLESALPDLTAEAHGEGAVVQTLWWLGDCHTELGEHRDAAERWLTAAETARHWPEQRDHAVLAHLAAEALGHAGLPDEADRAYARAADLWRGLGNTPGRVRALRARAWLAAEGRGGLAAARELMAEAAGVCGSAVPEDGEQRFRLRTELGLTHCQFGDLIARSAGTEEDAPGAALEEALAHFTQAVEVFAPLGPEALGARLGAELSAARLEADLHRTDAAVARTRAVLAACAAADEPAGPARAQRAEEAERLLELLESRREG